VVRPAASQRSLIGWLLCTSGAGLHGLGAATLPHACCCGSLCAQRGKGSAAWSAREGMPSRVCSCRRQWQLHSCTAVSRVLAPRASEPQCHDSQSVSQSAMTFSPPASQPWQSVSLPVSHASQSVTTDWLFDWQPRCTSRTASAECGDPQSWRATDSQTDLRVDRGGCSRAVLHPPCERCARR
jgi:hypothetical protein